MFHVRLSCLLSVLAVAAAETTSPPPDASQLVRNEQEFARDVRAHGIRDGFITWLAPTSVVFRPGPVDGRTTWRARPPSPVALEWTASRAVLSSGGEMGWTTGPWTFRRDTSQTKVEAWGDFVTVWKRQWDGSWRAVLDGGVSRPQVPIMGLEPEIVTLPGAAGGRKSTPWLRQTLWQADADFARMAAAQGVGEAIEHHALENVIALREGMPRFVGRTVARDSLGTRERTATLASNAQFVADAGDIGYTYGSYVTRGPAGTDSSWYVHLWHRGRERSWKLALDLVLPGPPRPRKQ